MRVADCKILGNWINRYVFRPIRDPLQQAFLVFGRNFQNLIGLDGERHSLPCVEDGDTNICASFDRRGRCIYAGNSKGKIFVICAERFKCIRAFKVGTSSQGVKQIKFARKGSCFLVNSADRVIRIYDRKG